MNIWWKQAFAPNWNNNNAEADLDPSLFLAQTVLPAIYESNANALKYYILVLSIPCWSDFYYYQLQDWIEQNLNPDHQKLGIP